jgi:hypothetical protein
VSARPGSEDVATPGATAIFIEVAPADIALLKFIFESYEGLAVVRTLDRHEAIIVVLVSLDFETDFRALLDSLRAGIEFREIPPPPGAESDWLMSYVLDDCGTADHSGSVFQRSHR